MPMLRKRHPFSLNISFFNRVVVTNVFIKALMMHVRLVGEELDDIIG